MGRTFVTGDLHGEHDIHKLTRKRFKEGTNLTKDDVLIVVGDFGLVWSNPPTKQERYWIDWLNSRPWTTVFIDGNHENFNMLFDDERYPVTGMFGGPVKKIADSVIYLMRGEVYLINGRSYFTMGGGLSIDTEHRREGISWWRQEEPSFAEWKKALNKAAKVQQVDYLLTHDAPDFIYDELHAEKLLAYKVKNSVSDGLTALTSALSYKQAFSGHMHVDLEYPKHRWRILYYDIIEVP